MSTSIGDFIPGDDFAAPNSIIAPKILIICHFSNERDAWCNRAWKFSQVQVSGLSKEYPYVLYSERDEICLLTTGMGHINAALAVSAITHSDRFDLTNTYFLVAGVGGVNPKVGTLGDVILSQYVVQADLQYQVDVAQTPSGWDSGYIPLGATTPSEAPTSIYGTELASVDANLRVEACLWAERASLQDSDAVRKYCQRYESGEAKRVPKVIKADVTSTNVFFHGTALSLAFENTCQVFTKHFTGRDDVIYGITAQEDAATIEALSRCAKLQTSRIIIMRTASNFDQPPPGEPVEFPIHYGHGGFGLAIENIYRAGSEIVRGILENWETLKNQRGS